MIFSATDLEGVWVIDPEPIEDDRGFFLRTFDAGEFALRNLAIAWVQASVSFNRRRGTLRGLHYQAAPHQEAKLVRCTAGAIHDVVVDLRPESPTRLRHVSVELSADNRRQIFVPPGCAHGFQSLEDATEVSYLISAFHEPAAAQGARFDDPALGLVWPLEPTVVSARDRGWPALRP
jgi:dTDP-4-dehydrorhamnose 3,5-epimerase